MQARRGEVVDVLDGEGAVGEIEGRGVGLVTWTISQAGDPDGAEVRALAVAAAARGEGIGRALLEAAEDALRAAGVRRAWLVTTNDNLAALALYQKAGWRLATLRPGALEEARRTLKPTLPEIGQHGIALRDELDLVRDL